MASPGQLIDTVAKTTGVPLATVTTYYRSLREAGLVSKGGRGPSAAKVTSRDAACLLTTIIGVRFEKEPAEKIVQDFARLVLSRTDRCNAKLTGGIVHPDWIADNSGRWNLEILDVPSLSRLPRHHSFVDGLTALIEAAAARAFATDHSFEIYGYGPEPYAEIQIDVSGIDVSGDGYWYKEHAAYVLTTRHKNSWRGDLKIHRKFTHQTIYDIAKLLAPPTEKRRP